MKRNNVSIITLFVIDMGITPMFRYNVTHTKTNKSAHKSINVRNLKKD